MWVGAVTDSGSRVVAKVDGSSVELRVSPSPDMSNPVTFGPVSVTGEGIASVEAAGLESDTQYFYEVWVDGSRELGDPQGRFHTHGPVGEPYSFLFACIGDAGSQPDFPGSGDELAPNRVSNHPAFDTVRRLNPLFVAHQGDLHYYSLGGSGTAGDSTLSNYRTSYDDVLGQPRQHQLYREVPIVYSWDDHDFGPNNSDGTFADKANAAQVYRERVPHYPLASTSGPIYRSFQVGRVLFLCSDVRYNRDPNDDPPSSAKTMLGAAQKSWMDTVLGSSAAEILIWQMPSQWLGQSGDSWGPFRHERDELVQMLGDHGWLDRMCQITADYHGLAIDNGSGNRWGGFPVYHFASIDAAATQPPSTNMGFSTGRDRYGTVHVTDDGTAITVTGTGWIGSSSWKSHTWSSRHGLVVTPKVALDYTSGHISPPFEPTEDDQLIRNDVTVKRDGGSSARAVAQSGPLSVDTAGRYDESVTLGVAEDGRLRDQAGWRLHLGTVDTPRYPEVTVNLASNQELIPAVAALDSGDRFTIAGVPPWLPPGDVDLIAQGYSERLTAFEWEWTANTSPGQAWTVGVVGHEVLGRADTSGSALGEAIDEADTVFQVQVTDGPTWITTSGFPFQFPFDIEAGGEVMRVTGVGAESSGFQSFTVERSINGIVKSHDSGTALSLAHPAVVAL